MVYVTGWYNQGFKDKNDVNIYINICTCYLHTKKQNKHKQNEKYVYTNS